MRPTGWLADTTEAHKSRSNSPTRPTNWVVYLACLLRLAALALDKIVSRNDRTTSWGGGGEYRRQ